MQWFIIIYSFFRQDKASGTQQWSRAGSPVAAPSRKTARELFAKDIATSPTMPQEVPIVSPVRTKKNSKEMDANLGPAALFSNSTVDLNTVCLNEELLRDPASGEGLSVHELTRSTPDIQTKLSCDDDTPPEGPKRVKSEPSIPLLVEDLSDSGSEE